MTKTKSKSKADDKQAERQNGSPKIKNGALAKGKNQSQHRRSGQPLEAVQSATTLTTEESVEGAGQSMGIRQGNGHETESRSEDEDEEDAGVTEQGLERLMAALGKDGLDDYDYAELNGLGVESLEGSESEELYVGGEEEEEDDDDDDDGSSSDSSDTNLDIGEDTKDHSDEGAEDLALDELVSDGEVDEDVLPRQKITINNERALNRIRESIQLDPNLPWTDTLAVTSTESLDNVDPSDDLQRELAFYKQALYCAQTAQTLASKHKFPFTRPSDYYAEMVKSDAHMERIRMRLLDETADIKKSEQAKRQRDLKKFGKQVQVEKIKERAKEKKVMDERVKSLKRKRKGGLDDPKTADEDFDVAVENAITDRPAKKARAGGIPRSKRDAKYGVGRGGSRHSKQNTRESANNFEFGQGRARSNVKGGSGRQGKGQKRLGKSRRQAAKR